MIAQESDTGKKIIIRKSKRLSSIENHVTKKKMAKIEKSDENFPAVEKDDSIDEGHSGICLNCRSKMVGEGTSAEVTDLCLTCRTSKKDTSNEYVDKKTISCDHCKGTTVSDAHKMIGCLICTKYYHVDCLLPADLPSDLIFAPGQTIRRKLGCIRCAVIHLCYKIRDIVTWRWREQASNVEDPGKYFMSREFLIHFSYISYWDCEWVPEVQLEMSETFYYRTYKRRTDFSTPPCPNILSDSHRRKMSQADIDIHDKYCKWGIEAQWLQPHKVIEVDDIACIVKWRGLNYDESSTEPLTRVSEIFGLQEAIDICKKLKEELLADSDSSKKKSKLIKLTESPDYLAPLIRNSEEKPMLHPYQLEGLNWLRSSYSNKVNTILADEMGLGKTIQAIAFLYSLCKDNVTKGPFLVVVPLTTIKNWEREFEFWAPELGVLSYYGDKECRVEIRNYMTFNSKKKKSASFHVLLTTYELIYFDDNFLSPITWEVLIVDEAHRLKNNESKLFKTFKKYKIKYRNLMTGTPLQNNLEELFHLLNFMEPQSFGELADFLSKFEDVSKEEQVRTLQDMLKKHILRRMKIDVMHCLPIKEEQLVRLELSNMQKDWYKMVLTKNFESLGGKYNQLRLANILMQLRKVCNHPYLIMSQVETLMNEDGGYDAPALVAAAGKMELLQKMLLKLRSTDHRVLIFSGMTRLLDLMEHMLDNIDIQYERIDGSVSSNSRQNAIDRFNEPNSDSMVFLLSTKAGGLGINLSTADTVIIYDSDWNPHNDIQALSRAHRIGQKKKVMIYRFVTRNTVEEKIMKTAKRKMMITNLVVKNCTKSEFHQILSFGTKELFDENASDDQKIVHDDAAIDELLDRNRAVVATTEGDVLDTCFSGFKVASCQYATENEPIVDKPVEKEKEPAEMVNVLHPATFWSSLLAPFVKERVEEDSVKEPELGKGQRNKKKVYFVEEVNLADDDASAKSDVVALDDKDHEDSEFDLSEEGTEEPESSDEYNSDDNEEKEDKEVEVEVAKSSSKYNMDSDLKRLVSYGIDGEAARQIGLRGVNEKRLEKYNRFCIVEGFLPVERMDIYNALMNFGLPPKVMRRSDFWWPSSLQHKTVEEMNKFLGTLMHHIVESSEVSESPEAIPSDNIDYDLLLARIGLNALIGFKVNQFESQNKGILEILTYKQCDAHSQSVDELKAIFEELKEAEFEFNIWDGQFSKIHSLWSEFDQKVAKGGVSNLILEWNKLHDYFLLSAMALYGYDKYLDQVFQDPHFQILFVPCKLQGLDTIQNNFEVRRTLRNRQLILENALLIEAQMIKICTVFDTNSGDTFNLDKLKHFHDLFVKQNGNCFVTQKFANTRLKLKAIAQLELLINDIECDSDSYRAIEVRKVEA